MPRTITLRELSGRSGNELPAAVPPPRFETASFETFRPSNDSQARACQIVRDFVGESSASARGGFLQRLFGRRVTPLGRGLYLDGGYGVGKTHLLAAAFHAASETEKAYLTFQELVHLIGAKGMAAASGRFERLSLLCLDEFELDDPGNTLIVKRVLETVFASGGRVITTSNTPPDAQGRGRFNADDFRREIQSIAARFETVAIEGRDYRQRERPAELLGEDELDREKSLLDDDALVVDSDFHDLLGGLRELHPIRYRALLDPIDALFLRSVVTIEGQNDALRFVHFIDQLYDRRIALRASGVVPLDELFDVSYRRGPYQKKHERCVSRLGELLEEPLAGIRRSGEAPPARKPSALPGRPGEAGTRAPSER